MNLNKSHMKYSNFYRLCFAIVLFSLALALWFLILPVETPFKYVTFYPFIVLSFYLCGIVPGVVTTALFSFFAYYISIPRFTEFIIPPEGGIALAVLLISSTLIGFIVSRMQHYQYELNQSEMLYLGILNDQTELICRFKEDGTILYVNDAYCRYFSQTLKKLVGSTWHPHAFSEDLAFINEKLSTLTPANPLVIIENRIVNANCQIRWGHFSNRAFFNKRGILLEMQVVGRDITERKLAEQALELEHQKKSAILSTASDGIHILDEQGNIVEFSESFAQMLGYDEEETAKLNAVDWEPKIELDKFIPHVISLRGEVTTFETKHRRKDGSVIDVEISAKGIQLNGQHYLYASSRKICDRKRLEEELNVTLQEIDDLYNNAPCGYHSIDSYGIVLKINNTELKWLGCKREEVIGKRFDDFITPESQVKFREILPLFLNNGHINELELDLRAKNGDIRRVSLSATALTDKKGHILKGRIILYDITELNNLQSALISLHCKDTR